MYTIIPALQRNKKRTKTKALCTHACARTRAHTHTHRDTVYFCELMGELFTFTPEPPA